MSITITPLAESDPEAIADYITIIRILHGARGIPAILAADDDEP